MEQLSECDPLREPGLVEREQCAECHGLETRVACREGGEVDRSEGLAGQVHELEAALLFDSVHQQSRVLHPFGGIFASTRQQVGRPLGIEIGCVLGKVEGGEQLGRRAEGPVQGKIADVRGIQRLRDDGGIGLGNSLERIDLEKLQLVHLRACRLRLTHDVGGRGAEDRVGGVQVGSRLEDAHRARKGGGCREIKHRDYLERGKGFLRVFGHPEECSR